jgi:ABC-type nickel/cobalt efflux system permease component RcnA
MDSVELRFATQKAGLKQGKRLFLFSTAAMVVCMALVITFARAIVDTWQDIVVRFSSLGFLISSLVCVVSFAIWQFNRSLRVDFIMSVAN